MQATERSRQYADRYKGRNKRRRPGIFQETPSYESGRKHCKESIQYHGGDFRDIHGLSDSDSSGTDDYTDTYPGRRRRSQGGRGKGGNVYPLLLETGSDQQHFPENAVVLLECMSNLAANEMFEEKGAGEKTVEAVLEGIKKLSSQVRHLVIVTNEIFSEAASYEGDTIRYQEYLGIINQNIGKMADEVVEVVYGIPIWHKGGKIIENAVE